MLQKLLDLNILAESTLYYFTNQKRTLTLVEACVQYNSYRCLSAVMNSGFSLHYISEDNSPLSALIEDYDKYFLFGSYINFDARNRLRTRIILMFKQKIACESDRELIKLYETKIKLIEKCEKFIRCLENKPLLKNVISMIRTIDVEKRDRLIKNVGLDAYIVIQDRILHDTSILEAKLELYDALCNLLLALESKNCSPSLFKAFFEPGNMKDDKFSSAIFSHFEIYKKMLRISLREKAEGFRSGTNDIMQCKSRSQVELLVQLQMKLRKAEESKMSEGNEALEKLGMLDHLSELGKLMEDQDLNTAADLIPLIEKFRTLLLSLPGNEQPEKSGGEDLSETAVSCGKEVEKEEDPNLKKNYPK